ncbi:hypothetical protein GA0115259_102801, partial [Streptomyces sp. MnatMP-M17]
MSLTPPRSPAHAGRRFRRPMVAATAVALGASVLLAPSAQAADQWGPGYLIPDSKGVPDASHIGAYGVPGSVLPGLDRLAYCADPELAGPREADGYGPVEQHATWTSQTTGETVPPESVARAAYVLSKYGQTASDAQAAAVDAVVYSYLEAGTTYALPDGERALERLTYPNVPPSAKTKATAYMNEADRLAGPYKINIKHLGKTLTPGTKSSFTLDVTSASGHRL